MIPYARQSIDDSDVSAVMEVLRSDFLTQGPVVPRFEQRVADYCGAKYAVAVANATSALHIAVKALGLGPRGLLWTSPISFVASANCALYCGASVDFVDIDPRTYTIDIDELHRKLESARRLGKVPDIIVSVDFAGQPCENEKLAALRDEYGFRIVEDASHAIGACYNDEPIGNGRHADITVFSFHPVKIITTGEGGMAVTNDAALADRLVLLRSHGVTREPRLMTQAREPWEYEQVELGFNYRLTELQAALGLSQMARIDEFVRRRREIAARYDAALRSTGLILPYQRDDARSAFHLYVIQVPDTAALNRRELYEYLRARDVAANVHYMPIYLQPYYRALGFDAGYCPNAEAYYARALSLPLYADLGDAEQERVVATLSEALAGG